MDAVIKVGGSLSEEPPKLKTLCEELSSLTDAYRLLVVPGGGKFADVVRDLDLKFGLSDAVAHKMAILAMDQFGLFLSSMMLNSCIVYGLEEARNVSGTGSPVILLPSRLMFHRNPLEHSWNVTSDSIAAYVASKLNAKKLILATDVDGIFTSDPKEDPNARLIERISANDLLSWSKRTSVDVFLPKILLETRVDCYVVNGKCPKRIKTILDDGKTVCTRIMV